MSLVLFVPLNVAFNENEHTTRLQALDELSDGLSVVCYLQRISFAAQTVFEKS